ELVCASSATRSSLFQSRDAPAVSAASAAASAWESTRSRWAGPRSSDWCACWPWMSTRSSPSSFSCASVALWPLMKQRVRPERSMVRLRIACPGSPLSSLASTHAATCGCFSTSNSAESSARSQPSLTTPASERAPTSSSIASTRIDLPAPVSPVSTENPGSSSRLALSTITKSRISSARSKLFASLVEHLAPAQLLPQRGEVAVARRMHEAHRVGRALEQQPVAIGHVREREPVEMRAHVDAAQQLDLDRAAVAHAHGTRGQRMRVERHQRERRHGGMQDRALRRHRVGGRARGRGDDEAVGAQRIEVLAVERDLELDQPRLGALAEHRLVERDRAQHRGA